MSNRMAASGIGLDPKARARKSRISLDIVTAANLNTMQRSADIFSWQEFMAINGPVLAGQHGVPDPGKKTREPWDAPERIPTSCAGAATGILPAALTDPQVAK